ncbi:MAG: SMI1/KNR4 family protein [Polyangiales bacterium]
MPIERLLGWIEPLVSTGFSTSPFEPEHAQATLQAAAGSAAEHERFLRRWNGCYALGGALHIFGACASPPNQSLDAWNRPDGWRSGFGPILDGVWFFAENAFGDQFAYRQRKVVRLRVFEARIEPIAASFSEWLGLVAMEPARFLATDLFEQCVRHHGPLPFGGHFAPPPTWHPTLELEVDEISVLPARDNMELRAAASMHSPTLTGRNAPRR